MIRLELTEVHFNTIVQALGNSPYVVAAPVIAELQKQVLAQQGQPGVPPLMAQGDGQIKAN